MTTPQSLLTRLPRKVLAGLMLAMMASVLWGTIASAESSVVDMGQDEGTEAGSAPSSVAPNCRYGVGAANAGFLTDVGVGWVVTFNTDTPTWLPAGIEFPRMVRLKQNKDGSEYLSSYTSFPPLTEAGMGALVDQYPGQLWIIGNEVDRVTWQDDMMPDMYATAYHDIYHYIKARDPSARIAVSALVQVTPGRIQYLDKVVQAYRGKYGATLPADAWTFHAYIFPEMNDSYNGEGGNPIFAWVANGTDPALATKKPFWKRPIAQQLDLCKRADYYCVYEHDDVSLFEKQVLDMRRWMKDNSYQNIPLILTEWSQLYEYTVPNGVCQTKDEKGNCFTPQRVTEFMNATVQYLETARDSELGLAYDDNRLVQQWAWYAMDSMGGGQYTDGNPSLLVNAQGTALTQMGQKYKQLIAQSPLGANLLVERALPELVTADPTETVTATLRATVRNNGTAATTQPFDVVFYSDAAQTQEIGRQSIPAGLSGCATEGVTVETTWSGLNSGRTQFWVKIDGTSVAGDNPADNSGQSAVFVATDVTLLPSVSR